MIKVVLLGGGNVAFHLANEFSNNSTIDLVQVYNRSLKNISHLENSTSITNQISELKDADIYIIAINDDHISEFSKQLVLKNKLVVHTSGALSINQLKSKSNKGVFYPLQSFSKNKLLDFSEIPFCIEVENASNLELLQKLTTSISKHCYIINSEQRKKLHVSAVFVNNFTNHLFHIGNEICIENNIPFEILKPLINETVSKINNLSPFEAQTGPAKRNDSKTIQQHLELLSIDQQKIYKLLTNSISKTYGKKL